MPEIFGYTIQKKEQRLEMSSGFEAVSGKGLDKAVGAMMNERYYQL